MITLEYFAQARLAAGCERETFDYSEINESLQTLVTMSCDRHGDALRELLLTEQGLAPWLVIAVNGQTIPVDQVRLREGDVVRLISPISGG